MGDYWGSDYFSEDYWDGDFWGGSVTSPSGDIYLLADFATLDTVTINIYRLTDDALVVDTASMSEIATTGTFKYVFSQSITEKTEYFYIATDGATEQQGKVTLGTGLEFASEVWDNEEDPADVNSKAAALERIDIQTQII